MKSKRNCTRKKRTRNGVASRRRFRPETIRYGNPAVAPPSTCFGALMRLACLAAALGILCRVMGVAVRDPGQDPFPPPVEYAPSSRGRRQAASSAPKNPLVDEGVGSYSRFSSDGQRDESISDQQRKCCDKAEINGHKISPQLEFFDQAVSGTKRHRAGLDAMLAAAEAGRLKVLYFHSLSRLSRESVITLPLLKHLVHNLGVRIISCTEGIDSNDTAWEIIAHVMSIVHEQYVKDLAANVFRGQEGAVLAGFSVGDYCFGIHVRANPGE